MEREHCVYLVAQLGQPPVDVLSSAVCIMKDTNAGGWIGWNTMSQASIQQKHRIVIPYTRLMPVIAVMPVVVLLAHRASRDVS